MKLHRLALGTLFFLLVNAPYAAEPHDEAKPGEKLGTVHFDTSCSATAQPQFERAVAMLHSFWFQAGLDAFAEVAQTDPGCAMAHWGTAMIWWGNPLAGPASPKGLKEGWAAVERAKAVGAKTPREAGYVAAVEAFFKDADKVDHRTRALAYEKAMEKLARQYPDDAEAAIFYALALNVTLVPTDKTYANQLKAAAILEPIFAKQPEHPGVAHYLIHSYDFPPIAGQGLTAANRYAAIAPSAPHALHMPSHIFTRVGAWEASIESNRASAKAAMSELGAAQHGYSSYNALHAMDYMTYGFLQLGRDREAREVFDEIRSIRKLDVDHFVAAFAFAAIPARYTLERGRWAEAAVLTLHPADLGWQRFPQAEAIHWFARGVGAARSGNTAGARESIARLEALRDGMTASKNGYWAEQAEIQRRGVEAWLAQSEGRSTQAAALMRAAAELEDSTEKHPVTPGAIKPAREMLGELLLEQGQPATALIEFETSQKSEPNRLQGLYGAARAAELAGNQAKARSYYAKLAELGKNADADRPEVTRARAALAK
jgi:tetratricopeptide (TPR) repeat protein